MLHIKDYTCIQLQIVVQLCRYADVCSCIQLYAAVHVHCTEYHSYGMVMGLQLEIINHVVSCGYQGERINKYNHLSSIQQYMPALVLAGRIGL